MSAKKLIVTFLIVIVLLSFHGMTASAGTLLTIYSGGNGGYLIKGEQMNDITAMDISVEYDAGTMRDPRVSGGPIIGDAQFESVTFNPGTMEIRIKAIKPLRGVGVIAGVSFALQGDGPATIYSFQALLTDKNGNQVQAETNVINPSPDQAGQVGKQQRQKFSPLSGRPAPEDPLTGKVERLSSPVSATTAEPERGMGKAASGAIRFRKLESVLEQFSAVSDAQTFDALLSLFKRGGGSEMLQEPHIALTDGSSTARLTVRAAGNLDMSLKFILRKAHLVSIKKGSGDEWIIVALPEKGTYEASLTVVTGSVMTEYPLTVAPPLETAKGEFCAADFARRRQARHGLKAAVVAGGGRPGCLDDYIYIANYLALRSGKTPRTAGP